MKFFGWQSEEVKAFLNFVFENKVLPLSAIFKKWSKQSSRDSFSVRNWFYKVRKEFFRNKNVFESLGLEKSFLTKVFKEKHFSPENEKFVLYEILKSNSGSVRSACIGLANGDKSLMSRYQNKYQNVIKNKKEEVLKIMKDLNSKGIEIRNPYKNDNIVKMERKKEFLSDADIKSLFMGLVRLVKKSAEKEVGDSLKREAEFANSTLQKALVDLRRNKLLVEELRAQNKKLKEEFVVIQNSLAQSQAQKLSYMREVENLVASEKMQDLKNFVKELSKNIKSVESN